MVDSGAWKGVKKREREREKEGVKREEEGVAQ